MKIIMKKINFFLFLINYVAIIITQDGYERYQNLHEELENKVGQATLCLARINKLKSVPKEYPNLARLAVFSHCTEIDALLKKSSGWFPAVTSVILQYSCGGDGNIMTQKKSFPFSSQTVLYKKCYHIDRLTNALKMQQVINKYNLTYIAVAKKSLVKDDDLGWIIAVNGIEPAENNHTDKYSFIDSLSLDEVKDLTLFVEETGFLDWWGGRNIIRDAQNHNILTIIDTEDRGIQPFYNEFTTIILNRLEIIREIKNMLGIAALQEIKKRDDGVIPREYVYWKDYHRLAIKPEIIDWIDNRIKDVENDKTSIDSFSIQDDSPYSLPGVDSKSAQKEFRALTRCKK